MNAKPNLSPTAASYTDGQLAGRNPHLPEDAADLVVNELQADSGSRHVGEEAEEAAREVEDEEQAE